MAQADVDIGAGLRMSLNVKRCNGFEYFLYIIKVELLLKHHDFYIIILSMSLELTIFDWFKIFLCGFI